MPNYRIITPALPGWELSLRQECAPIAIYDKALRQTLKQLIQKLPVWKGAGLALPQIGITLQGFIYETEGGRKDALLNPVQVDADGLDNDWEGCLSLPGVQARVPRARQVVFTGLNLAGNEIKVEARGFTAHLLQHEFDHLSGILFVDRCDLDSLELDGKPLRSLQE